MFNDIADEVFIDQAFPLLAGIHQALFTDPVDPAWDPGGLLIDIIQCFICEDVLSAAGISQMGLDVPFGFRTVQMGKDTVDIDPLTDCSEPLHPEFIPQFRLPDKDKRHRADGIKAVIQQKAEFLNGLLLQKMGLIQNADHFLFPDAADDLHFLLELPLCVTAVKF